MASKPKYYIPLKPKLIPSIDEYINQYFAQEDAKDAEQEQFFKQWYSYLQSEREKRLDDICDALSRAATTSVDDNLSRIVHNKYGAHPLCTVGSIGAGGQRFNIGSGLRPYQTFHCLYLANDDNTAYSEYFHYNRGYVGGTLSPDELALKGKDKNYSHFVVETKLENCIDVRDKETLREFCSIISEIKGDKRMIEFAKSLGLFGLRTIQTAGELQKSLLDREFLKFATLLDMPSNPQWFGYYCLRAGIQGIIYPSVRNQAGVNYAVLIDNINGTPSTISLNTEAPYIEDHNRQINRESFEFFKISTIPKVRNQ